ncbi:MULTISPECIES: ABC transporter ATP-binding protein/permease [Clostridium]|uniref:ABC transporter n=1 Tax=Clostridium disporicum TaxID=84024 RepID=A0A174CPB6_9CLOT|nr:MULTISPECIES: ABC transporter ATP-binding protein/permease [Clostridium]MCD2502027.1 ABC transporter ATP-binding protein/permease [Clostridium sp. NSJ-145]MDU6341362.1 ABC transporter ATP-binding protein/permease [Clostridium sp.]CUO15361.1 ABC transporter [Clostridium disporicum]
MLQLKNIYKVYKTGDLTQTALDGVSLNFRKSEFVAILGQSGSGKTTMLNIIGGLDQYDKGDLIINGKSTKKFNDRDWDTYRNHSIGFVFQSYNLIPHQTVLSNVELALTLSGVSKTERRQRAKEALEKVGLGKQLHKKPSQMSGGQMQRVAIARALINDPDILLADEPTGALDSETSVQIMELLKEISKDRLIIMVTHNPELAEEYANRIVRVRDGNIIDDTNPCSDEEIKISTEKSEREAKKTSMSFGTALSLSLNNLKTKKGRTILTAFAGSIGIIGIALILSLSSGVKDYINKVQEDTLSSYPISIESQTVDMSSMMESMMNKNKADEEREEGKVYSNNIMSGMMESMSAQVTKNDLKSFREYLENGNSNIDEYANVIQYGYDLDLHIYKSDTSNGIVEVSPTTVYDKLGFGGGASQMPMASSFNVWTELLGNQTLLESQYDVVAGKWPENYDEIILVVDKNNEISDVNLYSIGLLDSSELEAKMKKIQAGEEVEENQEVVSYTFDELLNLTYKLVLNTDYYEKEGNTWVDKSENAVYMKKLVEDALELKVVGIVRPSEEAVATSISSAVGYTSDLTEYVINSINDSEIVKEQKENPDTDVFTGKAFVVEDGEDNDMTAIDMSTLTDEEKAYLASLSQEELQALMKQQAEATDATYEGNLSLLGCVDLDNPSTINIYAKDFEAKESIEDIITAYNNEKTDAGEEEYVVTYNDMVGLMMSSVTSIIDIISYVLIAFVAISLVVSSIMIGIITYISVLERTKEIGILRSIGASKKDISRVFNAETVIVGFGAGAIGIIVTILLNIPINAIIKAVSGISGVSKLPVAGAIILIAISMLLTVIAGLIPAKVASKKDPVEALRTE